MKVEWAWLKAVLLFFGLILKGLAVSEPLPFDWGTAVKAVSSILWAAFDGAFLYLLKPPTEQNIEP